MKILFINLAGMLVLFLVMPKNAFAYLNPGSGSYFFQFLIAGLFGLLFVLKVYWLKVITFLKKIFQKKE